MTPTQQPQSAPSPQPTLPTLDELKSMLPKNIEFVYIDYSESFDDNPQLLQKIVSAGNTLPAEEYMDSDCFCDAQYDSIQEIMKQLKDDLETRFNLDENTIDELITQYDDHLRDEIYSRDTSTPLIDMLRNTSHQTMFYDLDYEVPSGSYSWNELDIADELIKLREHLGITSADYDQQIRELLGEASYGGRLVVFFYADIVETLSNDEKDYSRAVFTDPCIAVVDTCNGSGADIKLKGLKITFPFNRENLFIDKYVKYNYTFAVCGMSSDWCSDTTAIFDYEPLPDNAASITISPLNGRQKQEAEYDAIFRSGKCSPTDSDIKRHRKVVYENDFPCGQRCRDCGMFWID